MIARSYLIELVYCDRVRIGLIQPSFLSLNQFRYTLVMVFVHQAIHFSRILCLARDLGRDLTLVVLIHAFLAESSLVD